VIYTYTNGNGCTNTANATITVNPGPTVNAGPDQSACAGSPVTLSGSGAQNYSWNNGVTNAVAFVPGATQTYTLTGTDANGCQGTDQVVVTVNGLPNIGAGSDQSICLGTTVVLSGTGGVSYSWNNGVTDGIAFAPGLGTTSYTVTGTDANGCQNTDQVMLTVVAAPVSDVTSTDPLVGNPVLNVTFENSSQNANAFTWTFGNGLTQSTTDVTETVDASFNAAGIYYVVLLASNGICSDEDTLMVIVNPYDPPVVTVPNVFTPDGDGVNDFWQITVTNGKSLEAVIVNRWGNEILKMGSPDDQWDGTRHGDPVSEGTYFYTYKVEGLDGTTITGQGFVELIRK
jgi:gliding motility-associated-like protein